jgi:photosystem II stability/assembly factor-like uncharacterized protein
VDKTCSSLCTGHMKKILALLALLSALSPLVANAQWPYWSAFGQLSTTEPYMSIAVGPGGDLYICSQGFGIFRSTDDGQTWDKDWDMPGWWANVHEFYTPSVDTVYAAAFQGFYRSLDSGSHWTLMNDGLTAPTLYDLAVDAAGSIYVISLQGVISKTTNGGNSWSRIDSLPIKQSFEIEIGANGEIYASSLQRGLFVSTDQGASWTNHFNGSTIGLLRLGPDGALYLIKDATLYKTTDNGVTLTDMNFVGIVSDLEFDSRGRAFASTSNTPGIRALNDQGLWESYRADGLDQIHDIAISKEDMVYAIQFGYTGYRSTFSTTSEVRSVHDNLGLFTVSGHMITAWASGQLELFNSLGSSLCTIVLREANATIDLRQLNLPAGLLLAKFSSTSGSEVQKILLTE